MFGRIAGFILSVFFGLLCIVVSAGAAEAVGGGTDTTSTDELATAADSGSAPVLDPPTPLEDPGGETTTATAINDNSDVVGVAGDIFDDDGDGGSQAVIWEQGDTQARPLADTGGDSFATDINDRGQIVGAVEDPPAPTAEAKGGPEPAVWQNGDAQAEKLPLPAGDTEGRATAINDAGTIVGVTGDDGGDNPVRWAPGAPPVNMGHLPGADSSIPIDLNNAGTAVGISIIDDFVRAVVWNPGAVAPTALADLGGQSAAIGINNHGHIVGGAERPDGTFSIVRWIDGVIEDLGVPAGWRLPFVEEAQLFGPSINDYDQISLTLFTGGDPDDEEDLGIPQAFLWTDTTGYLALPGLPGQPYSVATDINNRGEIVGAVGNDGLGPNAVVWPGIPPVHEGAARNEPASASVETVGVASDARPHAATASVLAFTGSPASASLVMLAAMLFVAGATAVALATARPCVGRPVADVGR